MSEEYTCRTFYDACYEESIDCPYESFSVTTKYTDDVTKFWNVFEEFRNMLKEELNILEEN